MKVCIASDHRGFELKSYLIEYLKKENYEVIDLGTNSSDKVDYPEFAFKVGENIRDKKSDFGILICGSGIGMSIACNKVKGVRCARCSTVVDAKYTRLDNDANVLAIGTISKFKAKKLIKVFLETQFSNEKRHISRINKISEYESR